MRHIDCITYLFYENVPYNYSWLFASLADSIIGFSMAKKGEKTVCQLFSLNASYISNYENKVLSITCGGFPRFYEALH